MRRAVSPFLLSALFIALSISAPKANCASGKSKAKYLLVRLDSNGQDLTREGRHHFRDFDAQDTFPNDEATFNEFDRLPEVHGTHFSSL